MSRTRQLGAQIQSRIQRHTGFITTTPKPPVRFPKDEQKGMQWASMNSSEQLKGFFLGKASWLTDNEVTRVISFKNIILQLAVSRHVVGGSLFLDFHPVGHWLQRCTMNSYEFWCTKGSANHFSPVFNCRLFLISLSLIGQEPQTHSTTLYFQYHAFPVQYLLTITSDFTGGIYQAPFTEVILQLRQEERTRTVTLGKASRDSYVGRIWFPVNEDFPVAHHNFYNLFQNFGKKSYFLKELSPLLLALEA